MALSRRIARPLLASIFIAGGVDALRNPGGKVKAAEAVVGPMSERYASIPSDPETLVRLNGTVQVGAGVFLAIGKFPRLASVALIGSIIPTTYAGHRFWEETDDATRAQQRIHFFKNLGLLGGLILAALDTEGEPSLSWRAKRRGRQLEAALAIGRAAAASDTRRSASKAATVSKRQARKAGRLGHLAQDRTVDALHQAAASDIPHQIGGAAASLATAAGATGFNVARQLKPVIEAAAASGMDAAKPILATGADVAGEVISNIGDRLPSR
jgi:uncharacterized membrane protein YphA (DoxX/SURF4 family)